MHVFRSPIPSPRLLRLLRVVDSGAASAPTSATPSLRYSFSSTAASQSRSHAPTSSSTPPAQNASPATEESEPSQLRDKNSGGVIWKRATTSSSNGNPSNGTIKGRRIGNWRSSPFDSLFPEDTSQPILRKPIGRLDISEDSTYLPDQMEENVQRNLLRRFKRVASVHWTDPKTNPPRKNKTPGGQTAPLSTPDRNDASIVVLKGVGATMLESDIRRLLPTEANIPGFGELLGIVRITPDRHPQTLVPRPKYNIVFSGVANAERFLYALGPNYLLANPTTANAGTLPPNSKPKFSLPKIEAERVRSDLRALHGTLLVGACEFGCSVLLVASGLGGSTKETGRLPRTAEVRQMLEEAEVRFCARDEEESGAGVQRILQFGHTNRGFEVVIRSGGKSGGAEAKWIVRCRDQAEAHRVVREWNARELPDGLGKFMAEMIY